MICLKKCFLTSLLWLFAIQTSTSEDQLIRTKGETFLRKLRYNIRKHEDHEEKEKTQDYAFFRIAGKYMLNEKFYKLYQSLYATSSPEKMVSVITIRNVHSNKLYSANDYLKTIIKGIQHCVHNTDSTVILDGLALTIDYFDLKNLDEYNRRYKYIEQVNSIRKKCEILLVENSYKICSDALKYRIISIIKGMLIKSILRGNQSFEYLVSDKHLENLEEGLWRALEAILYEYQDLNDGQYILNYYFREKINSEITFRSMYSEICCYEGKIQCCYFTDNYEQFRKLLTSLTKIEYKKIFGKRIANLGLQYVKTCALPGAKEMLLRIFADIYRTFVNVWETAVTLDNAGLDKLAYRFCEEEYLQAKLQEFASHLPMNEINDQNNTKYRVENDIIRREIEQEQVTTIFYNGQICSESIYQLCSILGERKLLTNFSHQFLYIDNGRSVSEVEATRCAEICDTIKLEFGDKEKIVEFVSTIVPQSKDGGSTALRYFTYCRDVILKREISNVLYTERSKLSSKTVIAIDEYDKAGFVAASLEHAKTLTDKCLATCDKYILLNTHVVHVTNNHESYIIHVIQLKQKGKLGEKLLLIYDAPLESGAKRHCEYRHDERRFTCHNNAPKHFVENLLQSLQLLQLKPFAEFRVPNKCSLNNFGPMLNHDIDGIESIHNSYDTTDKEACIYFNINVLSLDLERIHIQDIYNYDIDNIRIYKYPSSIIEKFGIKEEVFVEIISKFFKSTRAADDACTGEDKLGNLNGLNKYRLVTTIQNDGSLNLRLCRLVENFYITSVPLTTRKLHAIISQNAETLLIIQNLDYIARTSAKEISFFAILSQNLCLRLRGITKANSFSNVVLTKSDCFCILSESIETLFKRLQKDSSSENPTMTRKWNLSDVQRSIKAKELVKCAEIIAEEINNSVLQKKMKVTSIKLKKSYDESGYVIFERFDDLLNYDPEHFYINDDSIRRVK